MVAPQGRPRKAAFPRERKPEGKKGRNNIEYDGF